MAECSFKRLPVSPPALSRSGAGAEDPPPAAAVVVEPLTEEPEEAMAPAVQDAEICLLKAGELT